MNLLLTVVAVGYGELAAGRRIGIVVELICILELLLVAFWLLEKEKKVRVDGEDGDGEVVGAHEQIFLHATGDISIAKHDEGGEAH